MINPAFAETFGASDRGIRTATPLGLALSRTLRQIHSIMHVKNPYRGSVRGTWLRGNLHAHTTASDGRRAIQEVIADYAARGYDFLMISDHDHVTGNDIYAGLDSHGLVLIPGNEVSRDGPHMLHVDTDCLVEPSADRQHVINAIREGRGLAIMNHPNWERHFDHCSLSELTRLQGYHGMEIFNGTIHRLDGSPYALDKWDRLLALGRRVWGFANDDSHLAAEDVALGWNMVCAKERTVAGIVEALRRGCCYASTGVTIDSIKASGDRIRVESANADRIVAVRETGRRFTQADDTCLEVTVPAGATYVRFECYGRREAAAWTQPFFVD